MEKDNFGENLGETGCGKYRIFTNKACFLQKTGFQVTEAPVHAENNAEIIFSGKISEKISAWNRPVNNASDDDSRNISSANYSENLVSAGMNGLPARWQTVGRRCAAPAVRHTEHGVID